MTSVWFGSAVQRPIFVWAMDGHSNKFIANKVEQMKQNFIRPETCTEEKRKNILHVSTMQNIMDIYYITPLLCYGS